MTNQSHTFSRNKSTLLRYPFVIFCLAENLFHILISHCFSVIFFMITLLAKYQDLTRLSFVTFAQQNGSSFLNIFMDFFK